MANGRRVRSSVVFSYGIENGKVQVNPARLVRQRKEENGRIRFLAEEEEKALRNTIREQCPEHEFELDVALNTGLRKSEQYGLTWDCVDFERRQLAVPRSKNGEASHIPLNDAAIAALRIAETYKDAAIAGLRAKDIAKNASPYVFLNSQGDRLHSPRFWFESAIERSKLRDFTWHCFRHTFASRLVMKGVDLRTVQELMGHKSIMMTVRYSHLAPQHRLAAVQRLCDTDAVQKGSTDTRTDTSTQRQPEPFVPANPQVIGSVLVV